MYAIAIGAWAVVVTFNRITTADWRLWFGFVERIIFTATSRIRMAGVVPLPINQMQRIVLCTTGFAQFIFTITRRATPTGIRPVIPRIHQSILHDDDIVRVTPSRGVDLYRSTRYQFGLILTPVTTKGIVLIFRPGAILIIERGQIVRVIANRSQINFENSRTQSELGQLTKIM